MTPAQETKLSKFLSLVQRHQPDAAGVTLDSHGWVAVSDLVDGALRKGIEISPEAVAYVVERSSKKRFSLNADGTAIRAAQGHSVNVDLNLEPRTPPAVLYHGTSEGAVAAIRREGLKPGHRRHVHLSADVETATRVGARHGKPVVLEVLAERASKEGQFFYLSENAVWLTGPLSPTYLKKDTVT